MFLTLRALAAIAFCGILCGCGACAPSTLLRATGDGAAEDGPAASADATALDAVIGVSDSSAAVDVVADGVGDDWVAPLPHGGPFVGEWTRIPGAPLSCGAIMAADAAASVSKWTWSPCASGRPGCRTLNVDWTANPGKALGFFDAQSARLVGRQPFVRYRRQYPVGSVSLGNSAAYIDVVQPLDDSPVFAVAFGADPQTFVISCGFWTTFGEAGTLPLRRRRRRCPRSDLPMAMGVAACAHDRRPQGMGRDRERKRGRLVIPSGK